jgi:hypothetical protein
LKPRWRRDSIRITVSATELRPDFSGIWELNLEKSILRGPAPKRILVKIEHREPELVQQILITYADGNKLRMTAMFETGASRDNLIGRATMRTHARWEGSELLLESTMKTSRRELHYKDYWFLSSDGRTLTMEHRDDDLAGQISVLERSVADKREFDQ